MNKKAFQLSLFILLLGTSCFAQQQMSQQEAIQAALKNNLMVQSGEYQLAYHKELRNTAIDLGKTNVTWMNGQFNSIVKDNNYTITQSIPFPTVLHSQARLANAQYEGAEVQLTITKNDLVRQVRSVYNYLCYLNALNKELIIQDSLFKNFATATSLRYQIGDGTLLEKTSAETQWMETYNQLIQNESDVVIYQRLLQTLLNSGELITPSDSLVRIDPADEIVTIDSNPSLQLIRQEVTIADRAKRVERNKILPDITIGYFTQSLIGFQRIDNNEVYFDKNKKFTGFELGVAFPLWFVPQRSRAKAASMQQTASEKKLAFVQNQMEGDLQKANLELAKNENSLKFYELNANTNAALILHQAQRAAETGEIGYIEFAQAVNQARTIKFKYLETLNQYNQAAIQIDYLTGNF